MKSYERHLFYPIQKIGTLYIQDVFTKKEANPYLGLEWADIGNVN